MSSLGDQCHTKKLFVELLGEDDHPVEMHVSKLNYKTSMQLTETNSGTQLATLTSNAIRLNGRLEFSQSYAAEVVGNDLVIQDSGGVVLFTITPSGLAINQSDVTGLVSALNGKQSALTVNGTPINNEVFNTFALTSGGDGVNYATSLVTAGALENFI